MNPNPTHEALQPLFKRTGKTYHFRAFAFDGNKMQATPFYEGTIIGTATTGIFDM